MDQFLRSKRITGEAETYNHTMGALENIPKEAVSKHEKAVRIQVSELEPGKRVSVFEEIAAGFTLEEAKAEALRCIECGCRSSQECKLRSYAGLFEAESGSYEGKCREYDCDDTHPDVVYDAHKCIQCRTCVRTAEELVGAAMMKVVGRGFDERIRPVDQTMLSLVDTNGLSLLVKNCPTGALVFKNAAIATAEPLHRLQEIK
jgi:formate dehydrogenase major subunit